MMHSAMDRSLWNDRFNRYLYNYHIIKPGLASHASIGFQQSTIYDTAYDTAYDTEAVKHAPVDRLGVTRSFWSQLDNS